MKTKSSVSVIALKLGFQWKIYIDSQWTFYFWRMYSKCLGSYVFFRIICILAFKLYKVARQPVLGLKLGFSIENTCPSLISNTKMRVFQRTIYILVCISLKFVLFSENDIIICILLFCFLWMYQKILVLISLFAYSCSGSCECTRKFKYSVKYILSDSWSTSILWE